MNTSAVKRYTAEMTGLDESYGIHLGPHHFVKPSFDLHSHTFMELVVITQGTGLHLTDYGNYELKAGDVFVIYGDTAHGFAESTGMDIMNFMFTDVFLEETSKWLRQTPGYHALFVLEPIYRNRMGTRNRLRLSSKDLKLVRRLINRITEEYMTKRPGFRSAVVGIWQQILTQLCRAFDDKQGELAPYLPLADTIAYMEEHFAEDINLELLAEQAHMSKNHFIRVFKQHYHETPNKYLNQLRIDHAKELLKGSDQSMVQIAHSCGFADSNYFARVFRQHCNETPRDFRNA